MNKGMLWAGFAGLAAATVVLLFTNRITEAFSLAGDAAVLGWIAASLD